LEFVVWNFSNLGCMKLKTIINILGWGLVFLYGGMLSFRYFAGTLTLIELILFVILIVGVGGLIGKKTQAKKLIVVTSAVGIIHHLVMFASSIHDGVSLFAVSAVICLIVLLFYHHPAVRPLSKEDKKPSRRTILVVDDDKGLRKIMTAYFTKQGMTVLTAQTGEEGLEIARKRRPDLIILDVILPRMKGRAVCSKLKEDPRTRNIPVIFLTAKYSPDDVMAEIQAGGVAHITKPINLSELSSEIKKYLKP
jgi:CheY-like chemotaxis protein